MNGLFTARGADDLQALKETWPLMPNRGAL